MMMYKVGITGGIGSGKSMVARLFEYLGIPIFNADKEAQYIMHHDEALIASIKKEFGNNIYNNGRINRPLLSSIVFKNAEKLAILNQLVHPKVIEWANQWHLLQHAAYTMKESALFFESGAYTSMDFIIGVTAPESIRIKRVMERDHVTKEQVLDRLSKQMNDDEKMKKCKFVIVNDDQQSLIDQVIAIHHQILNM